MSRDLDELKRNLDERAVELCLDLFGKPTTKRAGELRWGRYGSVRLKRGRRWSFFDFERGEGGSLLDAVRFARDCSLADAIEWAERWLGGTAPSTPRKISAPLNVDDDADRRLADARQMWAEAKPIWRTAAETYLRDVRGIAADAWPPELVRWHGRMGALLFAATTAAGELNAVQRIYLNADGTPRLDDEGRKIKRTRGVLADTAVRFPGKANAPLVLAEGPETAASCWHATGFETWANLGSMAKAPLASVPITRTVIVARDDDPRNAPSRKALRDAIRRWRAEGRTVLEATPWNLTRGDKSDFNDALKAGGVEAVRARFDTVLAPPAKRETLPRPAAIRELVRLTSQAFERLLAHNEGTPPFLVVKATPGLGKTEAAICELVRAGKKAVLMAPTHRLNAELAGRVEAEAKRQGKTVRVRIWRGREAENPATGEPMCGDLDLVKAARDAAADVAETACKVCERRETCAYLAQRNEAAEIWLCASSMLWHERPAVMAGAELLVIDEGFATGGLVGLEGRPLLVGLDELRVLPPARRDETLADLDDELMPIRRKLLAAISGTGWLDRERLADAGLTVEEARQARALEWRAKVEVTATSATTRKGLVEMLAAARGNKRIARRALLWRNVEALLAGDGKKSGRVEVVERNDEETGAAFMALRLYGAEPIREGWNLPTLNLDATARLEIIRTRVPHAELVADVAAANPNERVVQFYGKAFGKTALRDNERQLKKAWRWAVAHATRAGGDWLLVTHKAAVEKISGVPSFMRLAHFGALRGLDQFRDVAGVVVLGRSMPPPDAVERLAGVLTGEAVEPDRGESNYYRFTTATLADAAGRLATVDVERHRDLLADALRAAVADDELLQAIGRARAVQRHEPVEVVVLGNSPLPVTVAELRAWQGPSLDDELVAETGAWLDNATDAATACPSLAKSADNVRQARKSVSVSYKELLIGKTHTLRAATYRRKGQGTRPGFMLYDPRRISDAKAWLVETLGPLAAFGTYEVVNTDNTDEICKAPPEPVVVPEKPWPGGVLAADAIIWARGKIAASGLRQDEVARRCGISRPQLANALAGRFGLSSAAAERAYETISSLVARQSRLL